MSRWTTRRSVVAGIAVLAVSLAGCGGQSSSSPSAVAKHASGASVLLDSVQTTAAAKSARVALSVSTSGSSDAAFSVTASGVIDFSTGDSQMSLSLGGAAGALLSGSLEERVVDNVAYVQLPSSIAGLLGGSSGAQWISIPTQGGGSGASPVPGVSESNPTQFLAYLETVSDNVQNEGAATVRGVATTHYHATLDLSKALDQEKVPQSLRNQLKQVIANSGSQPLIPVDVWIDGSGHVRRITLAVDLASFGGAIDGGSGRLGGSGPAVSLPTVTVSLEFYDFGVPVNVQAPPANQVMQLPNLGGLGGLGGLSRPGASGSGSPL